MNVQIIKQKLANNVEGIEEVLNNAGFAHISYNPHRKEIRCAREEGRNKTSVAVNVESLSSASFSANVYGDIITLIQDKLNLNFPQTVNYLGKILNIDANAEYTPPFGGFYHTVYKTHNYQDNDIKTYDDNILNNYMILPSKMFLEDNIGYDVQLEYQIGYDAVSKRITVPWRYIDGRIGGITGRYNQLDFDDDIPKWLSIVKFPKSKFLFGYTNNYNNIVKTKKCIITESPKGVMQLATYGYNIGLAVGGSHLNKYNISLLTTLGVQNVVIAFDEGLKEDLIRQEAQKVKDELSDIQVGYVYDNENTILPYDSKMSPTDLGKEAFVELCKSHLYYI